MPSEESQDETTSLASDWPAARDRNDSTPEMRSGDQRRRCSRCRDALGFGESNPCAHCQADIWFGDPNR